LLAFRFLGKDRGGPGGVVVNAGSSCCKTPLVSLPVRASYHLFRCSYRNSLLDKLS